MGTRHFIGVIKDKEFKIAQYGQWNGYYTGQGLTVENFILGKGNVKKLKESLNKVRFLDEEGIDKEFIDEYNRLAPKYVGDPETRTPEMVKWHDRYVSRDIGANILSSVTHFSDEEMLLVDRRDFPYDSLFCEYAYVLDLDRDILEIYKGFNKSPVDDQERFYKEFPDENGYFPIKIVMEIAFEDIKSGFMIELAKSEEGDEEE